jgi:hypothetical protein
MADIIDHDERDVRSADRGSGGGGRERSRSRERDQAPPAVGAVSDEAGKLFVGNLSYEAR